MDLEKIPLLFGLEAAESVSVVTGGHINMTYLAVCGGEKYILQSLDRSIFSSPEIVGGNISAIERAFSEAWDCGIAVPHYLRSADGSIFAEENGDIWRMSSFAEASQDYSAYVHGFAVGRFLNVMNRGDVTLKTPLELHGFVSLLPLRNIHGDTKADNVIFGDIPTVIDLDTAMRGYVFVDFGDMLRSVTTSRFDMDEVTQAVHGFAVGVGDMLTPDEVESLPTAAGLIIEELCERYRDGERNFPNKTKKQCLDRAAQLSEQLEKVRSHEGNIAAVIKKYLK